MANDDLDLDQLDPTDQENWKRLREAAKRGQARETELEQARRENAFLRAGIDLSSPLGQMFAKTYEGKLDDLEAIRADAKAIDERILLGAPSQAATAEGSTTTEGQQGPEAAAQAPADTGTQARQQLADGASPAGTGQDPRGDSLARARQLLEEQGATFEVAGGELVAMRARAVANGDMAALDAMGRRYTPGG